MQDNHKQNYHSSLEYADLDVGDFDDLLNRNDDSITLKTLHMNIRSLNRNYRELVVFLSCLKSKLDLLILSEIWNFNIEMYNNILPRFKFYYHLSSHNKSGGVAIFVNTSTVEVINVETKKLNNCDDLWLHYNTKYSNENCIICIYRSPSLEIQPFTDSMSQILRKVKKTEKLMIVGDLNLNRNKQSDKSICKFYDTITDFNFSPLISTPTRITKDSMTVIDQMLIHNKILYDKKIDSFAGNVRSELTDHYSQYLILKHQSNRKPKFSINERPMVRSYTKERIKFFTEKNSRH